MALRFSLHHRRLGLETLEPKRLLSGTHSFSQMVVFGDSLSDTGNDAAWADLAGYVTTDGRFTSGPTSTPPSSGTGVWHEVLATELGIAPATPSSRGGSDWAYGGAESGKGTSDFRIVHNVGRQVSNYLSKTSANCSSHALYDIWAGGDDLMDAADLAQSAGGPVSVDAFDATAETAVANLDGYIQTLITDGARYILWPNLPELDQTPHALGYQANPLDNPGLSPSIEAALADAVSTFNTDSASAIGSLRSKNPEVTIYGLDVHSLFNEMLDGTYPGYTFSDVRDEASKVTPVPASADAYLFWDGLHPTEEAHKLLGEAAYNLIESTPSISTVTPAAVKTLKPGQSLTYTITVTDGSGKAISGATVTVDDGLLGTSPLSSLTTNGSGQATYTTTVPSGERKGTYNIVFTASEGEVAGSTSVAQDSASVTRSVTVRPSVKHPPSVVSISPIPPDVNDLALLDLMGQSSPSATIRRKMVENLMPSFIRSPME